MRSGYFIQTGIGGYTREEALKLIGKLLPCSIVLMKRDFHGRSDLQDLIHSIRRLYTIENGQAGPYIAIDQEGGNVVRLPFLNYNPSNAFLGSIDNTNLTQYVGARTGYDLASMGIDWDLAPVLDLANPYNQVILERSFSASVQVVASHGEAFIKGLQRYGVAATAKHFPGHGGVLGDSHLTLPRDDRPLASIINDMLPFSVAVHSEVSSVMLSHVLYGSIDTNYPATLSPEVYRMLREVLGFRGVILTDSLNMKAVSRDFSSQEMGKMASRAGADVLECVDLDMAIEISSHLEMKDEHRSAERIKRLLPEKRSKTEPPDEILRSYSLLGNRVMRSFIPLDPEDETCLVFLDETRESMVGDPTSNASQLAERLKGGGLHVTMLASDDEKIKEGSCEQLIIVGRNEHLRQRYSRIGELVEGKRAVFISTGVPADVGLIPDKAGYIACFSSRVDSILGAVYRALGFF